MLIGVRITNRIPKDYLIYDAKFGSLTYQDVKKIIVDDMGREDKTPYFDLFNKACKAYVFTGENTFRDVSALASKYFGCDAYNSIYFTSCADDLANVYYCRLRRVKKFILDMLSLSDTFEFYKHYWVTVTFRDSVLDKTKEKTRRQYLLSWLKNFDGHYCANIDYGATFGREHYHCLITCYDADESVVRNGKPRLSWSWNPWEYGYIDVDEVDKEHCSPDAMAKYVDKLTLHSLKYSTNGNRVIYSRNNISRELNDDGYFIPSSYK